MTQQIVNLGTLADGSDGDTNKIAWGKAKDNFAELYGATADGATTLAKLAPDVLGRLVGKGYISGLQMKWVSATALTLTSGAAYIEGTGEVLFSDSDIAKTGLSLTASTWYHVYLYDNAGTPDFVLSTTAPATAYNGTARSMTGDTSKRYVGSIKTDASSNIIPFQQDKNTMYYLSAAGGGSPYRVLAAGTATASTAVSLSGAVPATAQTIVGRFINLASAGTVFFQQATGSNKYISVNPTASSTLANINLMSSMPIASQACAYLYDTTPTGGGAYLDIYGYSFAN